MKRKHAVFVSLLLGVAVVAGIFAVARPMGAGASGNQGAVASTQITARQHKLDRWEASLRAALAKKPPRLPKLPKAAHVQPGAAAPARVVYVRAQAPASPPSGGHERDHEGEGGGFDD